MDLVGTTLMMGLIVSFILALQYGGQIHSWYSSPGVLALLYIEPPVSATAYLLIYRSEYYHKI